MIIKSTLNDPTTLSKIGPLLDASGENDQVVDEDEIESGAVATEIVIGKRLGDSPSGNEVGMLSMDGKFSIL